MIVKQAKRGLYNQNMRKEFIDTISYARAYEEMLHWTRKQRRRASEYQLPPSAGRSYSIILPSSS